MRKLLTFVLLSLFPIIASAHQVVFVASLTGAAERPGPGDPDGSGLAVVVLNDEAGTVTYTVYIKNLSGTVSGGHIHKLNQGQDFGGVHIGFGTLTFIDEMATGTVPASATLINEVINNPSQFYVNIHTTPDFPGGAIRGNITSGCTPTPTVQCVDQSRFRVEVNWEIPNGAVGPGRGNKLTDDSSAFWFFNEENIELLVKVLNACQAFNSQWVFAAGLTNVEVDLFVVDTQTGANKRYRNPQGTAFQPIQDTAAFACP